MKTRIEKIFDFWMEREKDLKDMEFHQVEKLYKKRILNKKLKKLK